MRFAMQVADDPVSRAMLSLFDVTPSTAYVEITEHELLIREGNLFHESFLLQDLGRAGLDNWNWLMGLGLHTDFQGTVAPITSPEKVIGIPVATPRSLFLRLAGPLGFQVDCNRLVMSLAEPDSFLVAFNASLAKTTDSLEEQEEEFQQYSAD
ncbi:hypothetical protein [Synechococcus sp. PCC 7336]|uniref:hypothetical protein n=1 Tax=Synechococcus sp. PCC 7336 TaxID=195250 RepID=UPI000344D631|nr:hypothetical protein [Synechococcus sp. PCC 7336]